MHWGGWQRGKKYDSVLARLFGWCLGYVGLRPCVTNCLGHSCFFIMQGRCLIIGGFVAVSVVWWMFVLRVFCGVHWLRLLTGGKKRGRKTALRGQVGPLTVATGEEATAEEDAAGVAEEEAVAEERAGEAAFISPAGKWGGDGAGPTEDSAEAVLEQLALQEGHGGEGIWRGAGGESLPLLRRLLLDQEATPRPFSISAAAVATLDDLSSTPPSIVVESAAAAGSAMLQHHNGFVFSSLLEAAVATAVVMPLNALEISAPAH